MAARTEKYRCAEFSENGKSVAMLFDEAADPHEMKNLADDSRFAAARAELSALVKAHAGSHGPR